MSGKKFGFLLALTFILASTGVVPALLTGTASGEHSVVNCLTAVQLFNDPSNYRWLGNWDPRFDPDWQAHYRSVNLRDCDVRRDRFAAGGHDRNAARDCNRCAVRD